MDKVIIDEKGIIINGVRLEGIFNYDLKNSAEGIAELKICLLVEVVNPDSSTKNEKLLQ